MVPDHIRRIFIFRHPVDFRKGHEGLISLAYDLGLQPYDGDLIVFVSRRRNGVKIYFSDHDGSWLLYKKFNKGGLGRKFSFLTTPSVCSLTRGELQDFIDRVKLPEKTQI